MGTRTFVKQRATLPRESVDTVFLLAISALILFGMLMLFSASWDFSLYHFHSPMRIFLRQLLWLTLGIVVTYLLSRTDYHLWSRLAIPAMLIAIISLIAVLFLSEIRFGAVRTLYKGSIQPSEFAKLVIIIYLSVWLYAKREHLQDVQLGLIPLSIILGVISGLVYLQPDLSATATIILLGGMLFFLAGGDLRQIFILLVVAGIAGWLVVRVSPTGQVRIHEYILGIKDPKNASYQIQRSIEAIVNGGVFGVGLGRANTKLTGLPLAPNDSIFAVIVEETGLVGAVLLIGLYGTLLWRGLVIARNAPDLLGALLASGMVFWISIEAVINMAVTVGMMPVAGNALPFISSGGSQLLSSLAGIGIVMNVSRQSNTNSKKDWRTFHASSDLRGRNGRRSVSGARRP